jgi:hypothetical protein
MQNTSIDEEIAALREQIAAADTEIARTRSLIRTRQSGDASSPDEAELVLLVEARDHMVSRLSRLESCKRTPE